MAVQKLTLIRRVLKGISCKKTRLKDVVIRSYVSRLVYREYFSSVSLGSSVSTSRVKPASLFSFTNLSSSIGTESTIFRQAINSIKPQSSFSTQKMMKYTSYASSVNIIPNLSDALGRTVQGNILVDSDYQASSLVNFGQFNSGVTLSPNLSSAFAIHSYSHITASSFYDTTVI